MKNNKIPLEEISIRSLYNGEKVVYEVPIYQRNYAWGKDEISALVQDVYDAYKLNKSCYYIGTLVSYNKGDNIYEIIDGQQRLTTINLLLHALNVNITNKLTYRARVKSTKTLNSIPVFNIDEIDYGIYNGYKYSETAIKEILQKSEIESFKNYFLDKVHIIHYQVPRDVDLNHYFEIMNSRGEQLEKHEIVKAQLLSKIEGDRNKYIFSKIWENCSDMSVYIQDKFYSVENNNLIFNNDNAWFALDKFDDLPQDENDKNDSITTIDKIIKSNNLVSKSNEVIRKDKFQPIIDFPNFLLIVLKLTRIREEKTKFNPIEFNLDDKELLNEFSSKKIKIDSDFVKLFGFNLLKAKYFLDNFIVHHSNEEDTIDNNPWKLQYWKKGPKDKAGYTKNLSEDTAVQDKLVQLLSMFEVSFTARQRKNYLLYCLIYLFDNAKFDESFFKEYSDFVSNLAKKYYKDVYLNINSLNEINTPKPASFDNTILINGKLNILPINQDNNFNDIYGDGTIKSKGIPLFIFNYLDYKLWEAYLDTRRKNQTENNDKKEALLTKFGCSKIDFTIFDHFYFSRTRRSLEHFFPQANVPQFEPLLDDNKINCLGNYAMIGSDINSSGSNRSPIVKLDNYLDEYSKKVKLVSVASLKFIIMMQICKDNIDKKESGKEWMFDEMKIHQEKMLEFLK